MLNKLLASAVVLTTALLSSSPAQAATEFRANITHDQEVSNPPIPNEGTRGEGVFILNDAMTALSYDITLFGLDLDGNQTPNDPNDNVTRTHFHAAPAGSNGGIVFGQIDPAANLRNDLDDLQTFPLVNAGPPIVSRITGVWDNQEGNNTTLAAQLANLLGGRLYFNVHTFDHGGGEIRGQVLLVPEPSSIALFCCGLAGLFGFAFRRRRAK